MGTTELKKIEIMDCTLRDGEQTSGVSFLPHEKLMMARMLLGDVNVDRIEVASARVSEGEKDAVRMICRYAESVGKLDRVEVLGFVDGHKSIDWIDECGCRVLNLLAKGSLKHCTHQLKKTPEEHIDDIYRSLAYAAQKNMLVNLYLEDWSSGMKDSPDYVFQMMDALVESGIKRFFAARYIRHSQPYTGFRIFRQNEGTLSVYSFRLSCPQRLRPCRRQLLGCC